MENYLNKLYHKVLLYPFNKIKHIHQLIKQIDDKNPIQDFLAWILNVLQYGIVVEFVRATFMGFNGLITSTMFALAFGMMRWLWLDFVSETNDAIKKI